MVNFLWFLGCSNPNSVCKMEISHLRGVLNSIVHQYYDSGSKKSLIHSHPASILVVIFSDWWCKLFQEYHGKRKTEKTDFYFNFSFNANFVKISILSFSLGGKLKKSESRTFGVRHLHFLVDLDLILVYMPLMCMVANCTFSLMGRSLLTMAYSAVFNHVGCLQLLLRVKFHPLRFQMGCTISCFSLQDCLWFENCV